MASCDRPQTREVSGVSKRRGNLPTTCMDVAASLICLVSEIAGCPYHTGYVPVAGAEEVGVEDFKELRPLSTSEAHCRANCIE